MDDQETFPGMNQERLQLALQMAGVALWDWQIQTEAVAFSPEMERLCGLAMNSFGGTQSAFLNLIYPPDRERMLQAVRESVAQGEELAVDARIVTPGGAVQWLRSCGTLVKGKDQVRIAGISYAINELKALETELQASQSQLAETQRIGHIGSWEFELQTQAVSWSPAMFKVFGFDPAEPVPSFPEVVATVHPDDREFWQKTVELAITHGKPYEFDYRIICPDGSLRYVNARGEALENEQGERIALYGTAMDISDRVLAQQDRDQFFALSLELLAVAGYDGYLTQINPAWILTLGWTQDQLTCTPWTDFIHPDDRDRALAELEAVIQVGKKVINLENRYRCADGTYKWFAWNIAPSPDDQKIYAVGRDITTNKQADVALRASEAQAREHAQQEALFNRLASQIRQSLDLDEIIATTVAEISQVLALERCGFSWYRPDTKPPVWEVVEDVADPNFPSLIGTYPAQDIPWATQQLSSGQIIQADALENYAQKDFRDFMQGLGYTSLLVLPIQASSERLGALFCGYCQKSHTWTKREMGLLQAVADQLAIAINQADLYLQTQATAETAQKQAQELAVTLKELQRTQSQLIQSEKLSSLGQMVAGVAHEINNPVNFIYGNLDHADDYIQDLLNLVELYQTAFPDSPPALAEEIEAIDLDFLQTDLPKLLASMRVGAERIREIVKSLRNFSRLDEAEMKVVDIHEGIDSTLMLLHHRLKAKPDSTEILIRKHYATLPKIACYPGQLNQVLMNLLTNAVDVLEDYNAQGSESDLATTPATIEINTGLVDDTHLQISITDNGKGIPEADQHRLFDPFFTTKPVGKGTGLGLSISYAIITEKHGGKIACTSTRGEGTTFTITLPI